MCWSPVGTIDPKTNDDNTPIFNFKPCLQGRFLFVHVLSLDLTFEVGFSSHTYRYARPLPPGPYHYRSKILEKWSTFLLRNPSIDSADYAGFPALEWAILDFQHWGLGEEESVMVWMILLREIYLQIHSIKTDARKLTGPIFRETNQTTIRAYGLGNARHYQRAVSRTIRKGSDEGTGCLTACSWWHSISIARVTFMGSKTWPKISQITSIKARS